MGTLDTDQGIDVHLGHRLRVLRRRAGLSMKLVAERLDISYQQINKYEKGSNRISVSTLVRLANAVGAPVSEFFDGIANLPPQDQTIESVQGVVYGSNIVYIDHLSPLVQRRLIALVDAIAKSPKLPNS